MPDKLTWDEIKKRFPDEWVVLVDYSFNDNEDLTDGVVYAHGPERAQVYASASQGPKRTAVRYTGEIRGGLIGFYAEDVEPKG